MARTDADVSTRCCVVGGGPAGMMLGFLLARAGVEVVVLEKHGDFFRDFRGDTDCWPRSFSSGNRRAHAMSPIGGVGINLAIQDAVAAANLLAAPLSVGAPTRAELAAVQPRRETPARLTQAVQFYIQNRVITIAEMRGRSELSGAASL